MGDVVPRRGEWDRWIGRRVRVFSGGIPQPANRTPVADGVIVAVCESPSIIVEHADGTRSHHSTSLPIEFETWVESD